MIIKNSGEISTIYYKGTKVELPNPVAVKENDVLTAVGVGFGKVNFFLNGRSVAVLDKGVQRRNVRKK